MLRPALSFVATVSTVLIFVMSLYYFSDDIVVLNIRKSNSFSHDLIHFPI